jgi:LPS-assembly protein
MTFTTRARFDEDDFSIRRFEAGVNASFLPFPLSTSIVYARYEAQPELGYDKRREGLVGSATYGLTPNWSVSGSVQLDLDKYLDARADYAAGGLASQYERDRLKAVSGATLGVAYSDECTTLSVSYGMTPRQLSNGTIESDKTLLVRLDLRTLGQANLRQQYGTQTQDGIVTR